MLRQPTYNEADIQRLFDRMGPTYDLVNAGSSFGFSEFWRRQCVDLAGVLLGDRVCDMMAGSGEGWSYVHRRGGKLVSIDFSQVMVERQRNRNGRSTGSVDVRCENALHTSIENQSVDCVISAFGLKTLNNAGIAAFAGEIRRILKPGDRFALIEISYAADWRLAPIYRWYLHRVIPMIGKVCLGDIECYRMLGAYTEQFGSCDRILGIFTAAGLKASVGKHFFGCATSLWGGTPGG